MVDVDHATPVEGLAPVGHHQINVVAFGQFLQLCVDRREGNSTSVLRDQTVKVLSAHEALHLAEGTDHLAALGGISRRSHTGSLAALACFLERFQVTYLE